MKTIKFLKNLGYIFYFFAGLALLVLLFFLAFGFSNSNGSIIIFGIIFLFVGFIFSSVSSIIIDRKLKNQSLDLPNDISIYLESKKDSKKMFKIGLWAFMGVGLMLAMLVGHEMVFGASIGEDFIAPFAILLLVLIFVGVVSWTLAVMRYFRK